MFGFDNSNDNIEMKVLRPRRIRADVVYPTKREITAVDTLFDNLPAADEDSTASLKQIFDEFSFPDKGDPTSLYNIFYLAEKRIAKWQQALNEPLYKRIEELRKDAANDKENQDKHDNEIQNSIDVIKRNQSYAMDRRNSLYQTFFEHLHEKHGDNQAEIDRIVHGVTDWHVSSTVKDDAHARILYNIKAYQDARKVHEAYGNPWYMVGMGALLFVVGTAFFIASLATGFAAPYLITFAAMGLFGMGIAFLGGQKASQEMLAHRVNAHARSELFSQELIEENDKFKESRKSALGPITWQSAPLLLMMFGAGVLLVVDFYLGGPLSALGRAINISILPGFSVDIPKYAIPDSGLPIFDTIMNYTLYPLLEIFSGMGTPISSSAIDFMLMGIIGTAGVKALSFMTSFSKNKTFVRAHTAIEQMYNTVFYAYSACGMVALPFSATLLPTIALPFAVAFLCFALYQRIIKGEEFLKLDARPGIGGFGAAPASTLNYNTVILGSALTAAICVVCIFALASNPVSFGVLILVAAAAYAIAKDQITASAERRDALEGQKMVRLDMNNPDKHRLAPSPVNAVKPTASASVSSPVMMSKTTQPCVSVKSPTARTSSNP